MEEVDQMEKGKMINYDIIGDVHGCATELKALLGRLGYVEDAAGVYRHPERIAVFVGDLIDRGDEQLEVLQVVKAMSDAGSAKVAMGNHEFNAICWATADPETGKPLRDHSDNKRRQHKDFLTLTDEDRAYYVEWFKTLPLWLDLGDIRVIHACWHEASMKVVRDITGSDRLSTVEHFAEANTPGTELNDAIEVLLKGPEISLVKYGMVPYWDFESKKPRTDARIRWWDHDAATLPAMAELRAVKLENRDPYPDFEPRPVDAEHRDYVYKDKIPLFYGHYWREWEFKQDEWTTYTACVDFSGGSGTMVAYRWSGEPQIHWENYVPHDPEVVAPTPADVTD
jgi:hypothetical protein